LQAGTGSQVGRTFHILGVTANFGGKDFVEHFTLIQGPGGEHSHIICAPIVQALGDDNVDRPSRAFLMEIARPPLASASWL